MEATDKKLLDRACTELCRSVRDAIRLKHYSIRTEEAYAHWIKRYIYFHNVRHPAEMGAPEVQAFLTHLAVNENVAASTQNQALSALLFLYREVLKQDLGFPIPSAIPSPPTCSKAAMTSARSRNSSAIRPVLSLSKEREDDHDPSTSSGQIYTHVLQRGGLAVRSPLDR